MDKQLKQLIKNQIIQTEIPAYFTWKQNRICFNHETKRWAVYNELGQMYNGFIFEDALDQLFNIGEYLR